ncbi:PLP-dependent cysteine synthase family protein [Streptomyces sp. 3N207]|uniref:PLP-dependent cysteine synthase family protein n=1 Tax=Streptomyces sp. 3N207 TaxID=3457417 RepID=UPI003FD07BDE
MTSDWARTAIARLRADELNTGETPLRRFPLPEDWHVDLYLKDESQQPTGSVKHRLARSLFLDAIVRGRIHEGTTVVEASAGSTAISEAYFARQLHLPFVAVIPASTSSRKRELLERSGATCHLAASLDNLIDDARQLATATDVHFMDQFTNAERALDWRGHNVASSILRQLRTERYSVPRWLVTSAGTGGTATVIGRYLRYQGHPTSLCVADPEGSALLDAWRNQEPKWAATGSRIEGIGPPWTPPSFQPGLIDDMITVPDDASIAAMHVTSALLRQPVGASTGTNVWAAVRLARGMRDIGVHGSVVTLICDGGDRYGDTYYSDEWNTSHGIQPQKHREELEALLAVH